MPPFCSRVFALPAKFLKIIIYSPLICWAILVFLFDVQISFSQSKIDSVFNKLNPQKFANAISKKAGKLKDKLIDKSEKVIARMQTIERSAYEKMLSGKDSLLARTKLDELKKRYTFFKEQLKKPEVLRNSSQYIPRLDSVTTTLKLFSENGLSGKITDALSKAKGLQDQFERAEYIKEFLRERKEQLVRVMQNFGIANKLKKLNKTVYYYSAQVKEYKEILKDPKKIEKKTLEILSKTKFFQEFMKKNSFLARLFPGQLNELNPGGTQIGFAGLQTRAQVISSIGNVTGPDPTVTAIPSILQSNIQAAQGMIDQLRNKLNKYGSSDDLTMPNFKPNDQKVKSFKKRLEFGSDFQTQKSTAFFPSTTDLGISLGYKLNDQSTFGIGTSFKLGWGKDIQHINITGQGLSLRSFGEIKIKNSFYASGGFEYNYQQSFENIRSLYNSPSWKKSALIGITKVVQVKIKGVKKAKFQLLYDFLSKESMPFTQPIKFRVGYTF